MQIAALLISALAMVTSLVTAWLTLFQRGIVKMTHPSVIFLGPDSGPKEDQKPKVFLRTLLFCTAKRGRVIESMHVTLRRNKSRQNFSVWVTGDDRLSRGSGMFVGETGVVVNHHFLTPRDNSTFQFQEGTYFIEVFAKLVDLKRSKLLFSHELQISSEQGKALQDSQSGIYFDWGPDAGKYLSHVETKPSRLEVDDALATLRITRDLLQMKKQGSSDLSDSQEFIK
jgi:hypothetical protein